MHLLRLGRLIMVSALVTSCLTACNYRGYFEKHSGDDYGSRPDLKQNAAADHMYARSGSALSTADQHKNKELAYSAELSRKISSLSGIPAAIVFLTDRNAYVGIMTDLSATGTRSSGVQPDEQRNGGSTDGVYDVDTGSPKWEYRTPANMYNPYFTHKDVKDISSRLRQTIAEKIREDKPKIKEVYISANREFVNQLTEFAKESWAGRPLKSLMPEFNQLVQYVFAGGKEVPLPLYDLRTDDRDNFPGGVGSESRSGDR